MDKQAQHMWLLLCCASWWCQSESDHLVKIHYYVITVHIKLWPSQMFKFLSKCTRLQIDGAEFITCWRRWKWRKKFFWQPVIEDRNSDTDMLVVSLCTPIILYACRYFHKRLNIHSHILDDSYHMSPLIEVALSARSLNTTMALNLLKCASFSTLMLLTSCFF